MAGGTARKSTHKKSKSTKRIRETTSRRESSDDEDRDYTIDRIGPVYIKWGKKRYRSRDAKGKTTTHTQYYIKGKGNQFELYIFL